jgi:hypothetical protein
VARITVSTESGEKRRESETRRDGKENTAVSGRGLTVGCKHTINGMPAEGVVLLGPGIGFGLVVDGRTVKDLTQAFVSQKRSKSGVKGLIVETMQNEV